MTTTNTTFNPTQLLDDNFDYINLLMFIGLYVACFVYLLEDTVKTIKKGFANMIGIFIAQFFFLVFATYIIPADTEFKILRYSIIIALILEFVSSFLLLLKYKNLQETNTDDVILESKILGTKYQITGPYNPGDLYTNLLISCDVIIAFFGGLMLLGKGNYTYVEDFIGMIQWIVIPFILSSASTMIYFSAKARNKIINNNKPSPGIKDKMIPALIFICMLNIMFVLFVSYLITKFDVVNSSLIKKLSWGSIFISSLFQIISIFMVIVPYKYLNDNYISKHITLSYSSLLNQELKDYNNLFVAVTSIMIGYVGILIYNDEDLNKQTDIFSGPIYYNGFIYAMGIAILSMSSEMIKISNDFLVFKNNAPKNKAENKLETVSLAKKSTTMSS
uniref:Uncharacterized protein n=1 Tax=viral metagenome TaxID=1070528 RepID=A0A6C0B8G8_9ZZZZ